MGTKRRAVGPDLKSVLSREAVEALDDALGGPGWLRKKRLDAWETAAKMLPPSYLRQTYEEKPFWSYLITDHKKGAVPLKDLVPPNPATADRGTLTLSGVDGVAAQPLREALHEQEGFVKQYFMNDGVRPEENVFAALHGAAVHDGAVLHVPENHEAEHPVRVDLVMEEATHFDHLLIVAEPNSRVTVVDTIRAAVDGEKGYRSGVVEIFAKDGAHVNYVGVQELPYDVASFTHKRSIVGRDARIDWLDITFGGSHTKSDITNFLVGPGGHAEVRGAILGDKKQLYELSTVTIHEAPMTSGMMFIRGALRDEARSTYRGLIHIKEKAHGVNSNQEEDTILLSEGARADAIPILEIDNNDVRCGHAAHVGELDAEQLFYLGTRGLGEVDAKLVVVEGFLEPLLRDVPEATLQERLKQAVHRRVAA